MGRPDIFHKVFYRTFWTGKQTSLSALAEAARTAVKALWEVLDLHCNQLDSITQFKSQLKTHLFTLWIVNPTVVLINLVVDFVL